MPEAHVDAPLAGSMQGQATLLQRAVRQSALARKFLNWALLKHVMGSLSNLSNDFTGQVKAEHITVLDDIKLWRELKSSSK